MNNKIMMWALLLGALFLLRNRTPSAREQQLAQPTDLGVIGYMGGEGTGYGVDVWGDEG
jgi:hypothetical protein